MAQASAKRIYEDFQPSSTWFREAGADTFVVQLPGFKRDQLKVRVESNGALKVTGERPLEDSNKWSRFYKDFLIPNNCNENEIKAHFADGVLRIRIPKAITQVPAQDEALPKQQAPLQQAPPSSKVNDGITGQQQGGNNQGQKKTEEADKKEMNGIGIDGKHADAGAINAGKMIGSKENQVPEAQKQKSSSYRFGMGVSLRFKHSRKAIVNVAVAITVVVALGVYAKYRLQHSAESSEL